MSANTPQGTAHSLNNFANAIQRQTASYHPTLWGDYFITYAPNNKFIHEWCEEAGFLKAKVRKMLTNDFATKQLEDQLSMIDAIQQLGIAYHFQEEIQKALKQILNHYHNNDVDEHDLLTVALWFRLLRDNGYDVSCEIFNKFRNNEGSFKEDITGDTRGMLSLYEASYLRVHGEDILDEALAFTKTKLEEKLSQLSPSLAKQVENALRRPIRKSLPRVAAMEFMSFYQENHLHNEVLLKFAKLDFNILQIQYQQELSVITEWWNNIEVEKNFPYARDRLAECYLWAIGIYQEPQYVLARKFVTKLIGLCSILDDTFDNYCTEEELELVTRAFGRLEIGAIQELPEYMKIWYQSQQEMYDEMDQEMSKEGRSYAMSYVKEAMKLTVKAYDAESKWLHGKKMPTVEEYMEIALVSSCYPLIAAVSFVGMGEIATKEAFDWLLCGPAPILKAACIICRLMDDIVSHQFEQQREHIPSAVECYMNQYGTLEEQAYSEFNKQVENVWKDINEAFIDPNAPPMTLLLRVLNLARMIDLLYKEEDGYTHSKKTKYLIASLLVNPVEI